jgi:hypothetical protein
MDHSKESSPMDHSAVPLTIEITSKEPPKEPSKETSKEPSTAILSSSTFTPLFQSQTYCVCTRGNMGNMIECDGPDCLVGWFHYSCVDVKVDLPDGNYMYMYIRMLRVDL